MKKYINQLISDINRTIRIRWRVHPPHFFQNGLYDPYLILPEGLDQEEPPKESTFEEMIEESEKYVQGDTLVTMFGHFGLNKEDFPPAERLSDSQIEELTHALLRMWAAFNYTAVFPSKTPARILYPILCKQMEEPTLLMNHGHMGIEFCEYDPKTCPFGKYCDCDSFLV